MALMPDSEPTPPSPSRRGHSSATEQVHTCRYPFLLERQRIATPTEGRLGMREIARLLVGHNRRSTGSCDRNVAAQDGTAGARTPTSRGGACTANRLGFGLL